VPGNATLANLNLKKGYWRIATTSTIVYPCPSSGACTGGSDFGAHGNGYCNLGNEGPLCSICSKGLYFDPDSQSCAFCGETAKFGSVSLALFIIAFGVALGVIVLTTVCKKYLRTLDFSSADASSLQRVREKLSNGAAHLREALMNSAPDESGWSFKVMVEEPVRELVEKHIDTVSTSLAIATITTTKTQKSTTMVTTVETHIKPSNSVMAATAWVAGFQTKFKCLVAFLQIAVNIGFNCNVNSPSPLLIFCVSFPSSMWTYCRASGLTASFRLITSTSL